MNYKVYVKKLKLLYTKSLDFYPSRLPITVDGLNKLTKHVLETYGLPDDPTYHHAIASAVMHLGPITHRKNSRYFARSVRKSVANQAAFEKIQALREEAKKLEATPQVEPSNGGPEEPSGQVVS